MRKTRLDHIVIAFDEATCVCKGILLAKWLLNDTIRVLFSIPTVLYALTHFCLLGIQ